MDEWQCRRRCGQLARCRRRKVSSYVGPLPMGPGSRFPLIIRNFRLHPSTIPLQGRLKNFNTIEEFRSPELKKESFNDVTKQLITSFSSTDPITTFNPFLLVSYADLKKYTYHYWFAFPALIQKPAWELVIDEEQQGDGENISLRDWNGDVSRMQYR